MRIDLLPKHRVILTNTMFAELTLLQMPRQSPQSPNHLRYRLALFRHGACVLCYDGETGKGDRRQMGDRSLRYGFSSAEQLMEDFVHDVTEWIDKHPDLESGGAE